MKHLFNQELTLQRKTRTSDGQGGWREGWTTTIIFFGRIRPASDAERTVAAQEQMVISHVLYCYVDVHRDDRVIGADNITYDIVSVKQPSVVEHHKVASLRSVQRGV